MPEKTNLNSLEKMSQALDTTYSPENVKKDIKEFNKEKKDLIKKIDDIEFQDKEYVVKKFKNVIEKATGAINILSQDIKIGSNNGSYMAMAELIKASTITLKELFTINKTLYETELMKRDVETMEENQNNQDKSYNLTSTDLKNMIKIAQEERDLNRIDVKYTIEDDEKEKD